MSDACKGIIADFLGGHQQEICAHPHYRLQILTARGRGLLHPPHRNIALGAGFGLTALGNATSRSRLADHLARVVIGDRRDAAAWLKKTFDTFDTCFAPLSPDNIGSALLASGTLPFTMEPVHDIAHAPAGAYWDGGLIDYHLALPYSRVADNKQGELVLYPHFGSRIVPGWLDNPFPWRCANAGKNRGWLDNVVLLSPARRFLQSLSRSKLPDRKDFLHYGMDHDFRILNWKLAIGEGGRLRDALAEFVAHPDPGRVHPL